MPQDEFNNCVVAAKVRRQADRRSVGWLCRRGGMRFPTCWAAGDRRQGGGGSGCWRADRRAVCGRRERAVQPERLLVSYQPTLLASCVESYRLPNPIKSCPER